MSDILDHQASLVISEEEYTFLLHDTEPFSARALEPFHVERLISAAQEVDAFLTTKDPNLKPLVEMSVSTAVEPVRNFS